MSGVPRAKGRDALGEHKLVREPPLLLPVHRLMGPAPEQMPELQETIHDDGACAGRATREQAKQAGLFDRVVQFLRKGHLSGEQITAVVQKDAKFAQNYVWVLLW